MTEIPPGRILVACSGGPDSTFLLLKLHESGREIVAAHYDHALREGSEQVAVQVAEMCQRLGVPLVSERRIQPLPKGSLQAAARTLRYDFLERARLRAAADWIATAHTADDMVEGSVLHLLRGCGLAGLRGIPARRGVYVRPMLNVWRRDVMAFVAERGIPTHEDPANRDVRFARVRARLLIIPALERDRPGITRRFHAAALAAARLQDAAENKPTPVEQLKRLYAAAGGSRPGLTRRQIEAMLSLAGPGRGGRGVDLPGGLRFRIVGGQMQVVRTRPAQAIEPRLDVRPCPGCEDSRAAHLRDGLHLRVGFRSPGLRMRPLGGRGSRKLQDLFVDARVPREDRDGWPLVFAGEHVAWVPGLAVDERFAAGGEPGVHVTITPSPVDPEAKVVRLENPTPPIGDPS
jgi:tRNA(Ile)-lysidine synthetase-like protein